MARTRSILALLGILSVIVSGFIFLTTSRTEAGFEWVPAARNTAPAPVATPLPKQSAPIVIEAPDAMETSKPLTPGRLETTKDLEAPEVQTILPPIEVSQPEPAIKVIRPGKMEAEEVVTWSEDAPRAEAVVETPDVPKTKIIMPEDAPDSARSAATLTSDVEQMDAPKKAAVIIEADVEIKEVAEEKPKASFAEISGFGSDMPLAFALSQVVPEGYAYSLGKNVNPAAIVSWSGGKPWTVVVQDMIKPLDLMLAVQENTALIYNPVADLQEEKHSHAEEIETEASQPPAQLTSNETQRANITNPGAETSAQPEETMDKIEKIAHAQKTEAPIELVETIEPSSGLKDENAYKGKRFFEGKKGESVKTVLDGWAKTANVKLVWEAPHDYTISHNILVNDDFQNALMMMVSHAIDGQDKPSVTLLETPSETKSAKVIIK